MCFSATASFTTAILTGAVGLITVARVGSLKELPLAASPLIFALQQAIEGLLWLTLEPTANAAISTPLTYLYLGLAEVFWPLFVPVAVLVAEPHHIRRRLISLLMVAGTLVAAFLLYFIVTQPHQAIILDGHIVYATEQPSPWAISILYLAATTLPILLSSHRTLVVLGLLVLVGCITAYVFYWQAFLSTWCFFAAAGSGVIFFHFQRLQALASARRIEASRAG